MKITLGLTLLLGLLSAVGPVSTDIYLPAFSRIDHEFGRAGAAQMTLAAWFVGLAAGQMAQGALADRLGRRAPLLYGTLLYAVASFGCALAPGLASFSICRVLAACFGAASMVVPRAVVRDMVEGLAAARLMSRLTLVVGVVPVLAPAAGGLLMEVMSWRALFVGAGLYGLLGALLVWRFLPETLPPERRLRHSPAQALFRYIQIAREPVFTTNALMASCSFAALFAYIGGSAAVYTGYFHLSPAQYGALFGFGACFFIGSAQLASHLAGRFGADQVLRWGARGLLASFACAAVIGFAGVGGLPALAAPIFLGQALCGLMAPLSTVNALSRHRTHAGSASALLGTLQFSVAALGGVLTGLLATGTARPMTALMLFFAALVALLDVLRPMGAAPDKTEGLGS